MRKEESPALSWQKGKQKDGERSNRDLRQERLYRGRRIASKWCVGIEQWPGGEEDIKEKNPAYCSNQDYVRLMKEENPPALKSQTGKRTAVGKATQGKRVKKGRGGGWLEDGKNKKKNVKKI